MDEIHSPGFIKKQFESARARYNYANEKGYFTTKSKQGHTITEGVVGFSIMDNDDGSFFVLWTQDDHVYEQWFEGDNKELFNFIQALSHEVQTGYVEFQMEQGMAYVRGVGSVAAPKKSMREQQNQGIGIMVGVGALAVLWMMS